MPNPWDVGSARLLAYCGFEALATTSSGLAWSLGRPDGTVSRDELCAHVAGLARSTPLPLNVDSEHCYPSDPGGIAETVRLLADAGAAGCSIEDYDRMRDTIVEADLAMSRVTEAAAAAQGLADPIVLTARCENHIRGVDDLDDTIARLVAYRDAGADCVYAPGLTKLEHIARVVTEVHVPVNILAHPSGPRVADLASVGVRRVSVGSALAEAAYRALLDGAHELLGTGTSNYAGKPTLRGLLAEAFAG